MSETEAAAQSEPQVQSAAPPAAVPHIDKGHVASVTQTAVASVSGVAVSSHGTKVHVNADVLRGSVSLHVEFAANYPQDLVALTKNVREAIHSKVERELSLKVHRVDLDVVDLVSVVAS